MKKTALSLALLAALLAAAPAQTDLGGAGAQTYTTAGTYNLGAGATDTSTTVGASGTPNGTLSFSPSPASQSTVITVNVSGSLLNTATNGNGKTKGSGIYFDKVATYNINIVEGGLIETYSGGAIYLNGGKNAAISVDNQGTILALNPVSPTLSGFETGLSNIGIGGPAISMADALGSGTSHTNGGIVNNGSATNTSALIESYTNEAVLLGSNQTLNNYGSIIGAGITGDSPANNGMRSPTGSTTKTYASSQAVDFGDNSHDSLINWGTISGNPHGVDMGDAKDIYIENHGTIIGRNGSGIGGDTTTAAASNVVIVNYGVIRADYAGAANIIDRSGAASTDGDPDGIDIDGGVTITNYGTIQTTSAAGGWDTAGRTNISDGLGIGGGIVDNYGTIDSAQAAVTVNNDGTNGQRSGSTALTLTNEAGGVIIGRAGYAIRSENQNSIFAGSANDTVINKGTITGGTAAPDPSVVVTLQDGTVDPVQGTLNGVTYNPNGTYTDATGTHAGNARFVRGDGSAIQLGEGDDVLDNYGRIVGLAGKAVNMEGGNDKVIVRAGSSITGLVDGGTGTNTLEYHQPGLTDARKAALAAGQTVYINGTPYVDFTDFTGSDSASYTSLSHSSATRGVASFLDNAGALGSSTATLLGQVAAASNVDEALRQLTPTALAANTQTGVNTAVQTAQALGGRMDNIRAGGGGSFDFSGLEIWDADMPMAFNNARSLLAGSDISSGTASDVHGPVIAHTDPDALNARRWGFFVNGNAIFGDQGATTSSPGYNFTAAAATLGIDYRLTRDVTVGGFGGYSHTHANLDSFGSTSEVDTGLVGGYLAWSRKDWFFNGSAIYGRNTYDNDRAVLGTSNTSDPDGNQYSLAGTVGRDFRLGAWTLTPQGGLQYSEVFIDRFTETGPAALSVASTDTQSLRSNLGARLRYDWRMPWGRIVPEFRASWQHEFLASQRSVQASFVDSPNAGTFSSTATGSGEDFATVGFGVASKFAERWTATLDYDYQVGGLDYEAQQVTGGVRYAF